MRHLKNSRSLSGRKTDTFSAVREQLVSIAENEPDESTEFEGMVDFHWRFDSHQAYGS
jgi:hypothetical protein